MALQICVTKSIFFMWVMLGIVDAVIKAKWGLVRIWRRFHILLRVWQRSLWDNLIIGLGRNAYIELSKVSWGPWVLIMWLMISATLVTIDVFESVTCKGWCNIDAFWSVIMLFVVCDTSGLLSLLLTLGLSVVVVEC